MMDGPKLRRVARLTLAGLGLTCLALLFWANPSARIATDVLDLVPRDERQPELVLIRSLAGEQQARVALFALDGGATADARQAGGAAFVNALKQSGAFSSVVALADPQFQSAFGRELFEQRFDLLLPSWLAARRAEYRAAGTREPWPDWLAARTARELQDYLSEPEAVAFQDLVPSDPMLLVPKLAGSAKLLDPAPGSGGGPILVWALLRDAPFSGTGQRSVFAAVDQGQAAAKAADPTLRLRWTSLARFAAASRQRIQGELSTLNTASIVAVLLVAALCLRRFWKALNLAPVILGSVLFAWTVTLVAFPHVHILVFVVGALLTGVAIDYGFYFYLQAPLSEQETYLDKARRLFRPLMGSALTAILGFSLLTFSDLPLIRQLGIFVSAGLLGAVAVAFLWFAQVRVPYIACRRIVLARPQPSPRARAIARAALIAGILVALVGPWLLRWRDQIRQLDIPAPRLEAEAHDVRILFGDRDDRAAYITHADTVEHARDLLERFILWHRQEYPNHPLTSAAQLLPTRQQWSELVEARSELRDFPRRLDQALTASGFDAASFEPFRTAWNQWLATTPPAYDEIARELAQAMQGPLSALFSISPSGVWFISMTDHRADRDPPPGLGTASASQLETLNRLFGEYRISALRLSLIGLGLVGASVFLIYGPRHGAGIFAVPVGACFFTFGVFGLLGVTLNLFHLLGAFLGVCLSHNYSIFSAENVLRHEPQPPSIRLSALTTAASFGVLTLSHIPVVAALGATVSLTVITALAIVELKLLAELTPPRHF